MKIFSKATVSILMLLIAGLLFAGDKKEEAQSKHIDISLEPAPVDISSMIFRFGKSAFTEIQEADAYLVLGAVNRPTTSGNQWIDDSSVRPVAYFRGRTVDHISLNGVVLDQKQNDVPKQYVLSPDLVDRNLGFDTMATWRVVDGNDSFTAKVKMPAALAPSVSCGSSYSLSSGNGFQLIWQNPQGGDVGVYAHFYPEVADIGSHSKGVFTTVAADSGRLQLSAKNLSKINGPGWLNILVSRGSYDIFQYGRKKAVAGVTAEETITVRINR